LSCLLHMMICHVNDVLRRIRHLVAVFVLTLIFITTALPAGSLPPRQSLVISHAHLLHPPHVMPEPAAYLCMQRV